MAIKSQYRPVVGAASKAAGLVGVPGAFSFGLDVTAMTGIWASMLVALARRSGHDMDRVFAGKVAAGVLTGAAAYVGGSKLAMKLLHVVPLAGSLAAVGVNSLLNYLYTYQLGATMAGLFDKGDYDAGDVGALVTAALPLVAAVPGFGDVRDMVRLASEPVDPDLLATLRRPAAG